MTDHHEPMSDAQLETLAHEIAIPLQAHPAGPIAQLAQRNAWASLNYLMKQYQDLRAALEREQREHGNCEDVNAQRFQTLMDTIISLTQQVTAMRPMVEAVAEAGADFDYNGNSWLLFPGPSAAEQVREQAQAYLAEHPAPDGEAS